MKRLHRKDLFSWSVFNERLDIDFNSVAWVRPDGNILFDPVPLTPHDRAHLAQLGGVRWIVISNSAHVRDSAQWAEAFKARLAGPRAERATFPLACERWLGEGEELVPGLVAREMEGSKTPGELAFVLEETTLVTGDLIRSHRAGRLMLLLPEQGLTDRARALASVARLAALPRIEAVLVGDGWSVFRDGRTLLAELAAGQV
jgi:glyoxylase-like metal-dependent hydrolase (beta-lactamase superfamily II)